MPVDTKQVVRNAADKFFCRPIGRAMANPLALAGLITIVIMLIVTFSFDHNHKFRTTIRIFAVVTTCMFINNHIMLNEKHCALMSNDQRDVLRIISAPTAAPIVRPSSVGGVVKQIVNNSPDDESDSDMVVQGQSS